MLNLFPLLLQQRDFTNLSEADVREPCSISRFGLIPLKNSFLIDWLFTDSIALLIGGFCDDGTEAGSTGGAVL